MNATYRNAVATHGGTLITHIGLLNSGVEVSGGDPAYARKAVTWDTASDGTIRPDADLEFDIPEDGVVNQWQGYSDATGGTAYGTIPLTEETFAAQGTYTLTAASSGINHATP